MLNRFKTSILIPFFSECSSKWVKTKIIYNRVVRNPWNIKIMFISLNELCGFNQPYFTKMNTFSKMFPQFHKCYTIPWKAIKLDLQNVPAKLYFGQKLAEFTLYCISFTEIQSSNLVIKITWNFWKYKRNQILNNIKCVIVN